MHTIRRNIDSYEIGILETSWVSGVARYVNGYNDPVRGWVNSYTQGEPSQPNTFWRVIAITHNLELEFGELGFQ
jgi:hypothetical protein